MVERVIRLDRLDTKMVLIFSKIVRIVTMTVMMAT